MTSRLKQIPKNIRQNFSKEIKEILTEDNKNEYIILCCKTEKNKQVFKVLSNLNESEVIGRLERAKINLILDVQQERELNLSYVG